MNVLLSALFALTLSAGAPAGMMPTSDDGPASPAAVTAEEAAPAPIAFDAPPPVGTRARCPVMKGEFTVTEATQRSEHGGKHYVFCCPGCKPQFDADPAKYLTK